jgi:hypothetical protein
LAQVLVRLPLSAKDSWSELELARSLPSATDFLSELEPARSLPSATGFLSVQEPDHLLLELCPIQPTTPSSIPLRLQESP